MFPLNSDVLLANRASLVLIFGALRQHEVRIAALGAQLLFDNGGLSHGFIEFMKHGCTLTIT